MPSNSLAKGQPSGLPVHSAERRRRPRFDMHFSVLLRALGDSWTAGKTADVSATGAFFVTDRPFRLGTDIEYLLTFPPELTKAPTPLRVRFFGQVLRCERVPDSDGIFDLAVQSTDHRYLDLEQAGSFDAIEQKLRASSSTVAAILG